MSADRTNDLAWRALTHAALADPRRLAITEHCRQAMPPRSDELAGVAGDAVHPLTTCTRSSKPGSSPATAQGQPPLLDLPAAGPRRAAALAAPTGSRGVGGVFVSTAEPRSHLAAALWRLASTVPAVSAWTHPAAAIDPGAIAAAQRHRLPLPRLRPRHISDVRRQGDMVITVCDLAHEELAEAAAVHWSVPDPVPAGDPGSFDAALAQLAAAGPRSRP